MQTAKQLVVCSWQSWWSFAVDAKCWLNGITRHLRAKPARVGGARAMLHPIGAAPERRIIEREVIGLTPAQQRERCSGAPAPKKTAEAA